MNFYIDAGILQLSSWRGPQFYIYNILTEMLRLGQEHQFHLHFNRAENDPRIDLLTNKPHVSRHDWPGLSNSFLTIPCGIWQSRSKVYYAMAGPHKLLWVPPYCSTTVSIWDSGCYLYPELYGVNNPADNLRLQAKRIKAYDYICTLTETTKLELVDLFKISPDRIFLAPGAVNVNTALLSEKPKLLRDGVPYFLMANPGNAWKNWKEVLAAFSIYTTQTDASDTVLILAGDLRDQGRLIQETIAADLRLRNRVVCLGYVTDAELRYLYRFARLFVFPSVYEGFGLPALEAMAEKTPVIISDIPVFREVFGDAAWRVPLNSPEEMAFAFAQISSDEDLRSEYISRGCERVNYYTWEKSAMATLSNLVSMA